MDRIGRLRMAGWCGFVGGGLWFAQAVLQWAGLIETHTPGTTAFVVGGAIATGYLALVLLGFLGIGWGGALGGRIGKSVFGIAVLGYVLMVIGGVLTVFGIGPLTDPDTAVSLIYLLGRLIAVIFTLFTGVAVVLARRWQGWTRWAPLMFGLWPIFGELLPVLVTGQQPHELLNGAWGVWAALLGLAVLAQTRTAHVPSTVVAEQRMTSRCLLRCARGRAATCSKARAKTKRCGPFVPSPTAK